MEHTTFDYLFVLSLYDEAIPLSRLLFHLETGGRAERTAYLETKRDLKDLAKGGLVALGKQDGADCVRLTGLGRQMAEAAASAMADEMVASWQGRSLQFAPPYGQPA